MAKGGSNSSTNNSKKPTRFHFNIGVIIFGAISIYLLATVILYFTSTRITSYEVQKGRLARNNAYTGVVLRDESVINADSGGYVAYYQTEAQKVKVGSTVYSVDTNGSTTKTVSAYTSNNTLTSSNLKSLSDSIADFQTTASDTDFEQMYDFQYRLESQLLDIKNQSIISQLDTLSSYDPDTFKVYKAPVDGIIVYSIDGLEGLTIDGINDDIMNKAAYNKYDLRENSEISTGNPAYKIVTNEDWSICVKLNDETYTYLTENNVSEIQIRIKKDNALLWANATYSDINGMHIARLRFDNSMVRYVSDRYLDIEMIIENESGLKIPQSAALTKDFYLVPKSYITKGGDSNSSGVLIKTVDKNGNASAVFQAAEVYNIDEKTNMAYLDTNDITAGSVLYLPDQSETFTIGDTDHLRGVYCINKGYAVFRLIDVVYENSEYCIVKEGTDYGISNFDFIALDSSSVKENAAVY